MKFKEEIAKYVQKTPRMLWKYVSSKAKTKSGVPRLYVDENNQVKTAGDKEKVMVFVQ